MISEPADSQRRSSLSFAVLALLAEQPMHAFGLHKLMHERGQHVLFNIRRRNSIQQVLDRLCRDGFTEIVPEHEGTSRRVVHRVTPAGRELMLAWLRRTLAVPQQEHPSLPAAVSLAAFLPPEEVRRLLQERHDTLTSRVEQDLDSLADTEQLPKVFVLEVDLLVHTTRSEMAWIEETLRRIDSGELTWDPQQLLAQSDAAVHLDE